MAVQARNKLNSIWECVSAAKLVGFTAFLAECDAR